MDFALKTKIRMIEQLLLNLKQIVFLKRPRSCKLILFTHLAIYSGDIVSDLECNNDGVK